MDIIKLSGIAVTGALFSIIVKKDRPEMAILISITTGVILLGYVLSTLGQVISMIKEIIEESGVDGKYFSLLIKIIATAYICEITSEVCRDAGEGAIAAKIEMGGKLLIMLMSLPLVKSFLEVCINAINMV